jgi:hypothetical protein
LHKERFIKKIVKKKTAYSILNKKLNYLTVHPVPAPFSTNELRSNNISEGGNNQKEILFNRGNAISAAPTCTGKR